MLINVLLLAIYLTIKPDKTLIAQFFAVIVVCQIFNFDYLGQYLCAVIGIILSFLLNIIPLSFIVSI